MKLKTNERSWVEIDLAAFTQNLTYLKGFLAEEQSFLQIVKADAYGHGALEIAQCALDSGAAYLGVANPEEGKLLRIQGIKAPILVLSPSLPSEIPIIVDYGLVPGVSDLEFARALSDYRGGTRHKIHLKIDTGMHRSGFRSDTAFGMYSTIAALPNLEIEGVFSHFAASESDPDFSSLQEQEFKKFVDALPIKPRYIHLSNSAGSVKGYGRFCNLVRLGILSFGVDSIGDPGLSAALQPVMTFRSTLSQIKTIYPGESVGYNREWIASQEGRYAVVPVGYADGYDFLLSNKAEVLVDGTLCPVIGRISMDMITIDISKVVKARVGDVINLIGKGSAAIRVERIASVYQGSAYELLCQIGRRARRYYTRGDELLHSAPLARRDFVAHDFGDRKLSEIISAALAQRLGSEEIGDLIYREILRSFFADKDRDVHYRSNFIHEITFQEGSLPDYYMAQTTLSYHKVLSAESFIIACASSDEELRKYFQRRDVEYRWLLDEKLALNSDSFKVNAARINGVTLNTELRLRDSSLEIHCSHPSLKPLVGTQVLFEIDTTTVYSKSRRQFSVFISELTQGVKIGFTYRDCLSDVQPVSIFSGQQKNPPLYKEEGRIVVESSPGEWIFPLSGVVFSY